MLRRLTRTAISLLLLLAAYGLYGRLVVPLVEPAARRPSGRASTEAERRAARDAVRLARAALAPWFSADDWELRSSKILETPQGMLLLDQYQNLGEGRIHVRPCTMVLWPHGHYDSEADRQRRAIILQAPSGAILQFDSDFDLKQGRVGKLLGGKLVDRVTIRSDYKQPGPQDDLLITTRDVYLTEERFTSAHEVHFRLAGNEGQGRELVVLLVRTPDAAGLGGAGRAVRSLELLREVRLNLQHHGAGLFAGLAPRISRSAGPLGQLSNPHAASSATTSPHADEHQGDSHGLAGLAAAEGATVDVTCEGPFRFDLEHQVATFERRVTVRRHLERGAPDALDCELLAIHFQRVPQHMSLPPTGENTAIAQLEADTRLVPSRIVATGNPVVVESPLYGVSARATRLEYDLESGVVRLHDRKQALLRTIEPRTGEERVIRSTTLEFTPDPQGNWGTLLATGPGSFRGWLEESGSQDAAVFLNPPADTDDAGHRAAASQADVSWEQRLHFRLHEGLRVLSLVGPARVALPGRGSLAAAEIHMWLSEAATPMQGPAESAATRLVPERLMATGAVEIDTPQFIASVSNLQVWFEHLPQERHNQSDERDTAALKRRGGEAGAAPAFSAAHEPHASVQGSGAPTLLPTMGNVCQTAGPYDIEAGLLQARLLVVGDRTFVPLEVRAQSAVRLRELCVQATDQTRLALDGELVHLVQQNESSALSMVGSPATLAAAGITLVGNHIQMDQAEGLLAIDGHGKMDVDLPGSQAPALLGSKTPTPNDRLHITWSNGFKLEGRTARFVGSVVARRSHEVLKTEELVAEFTAPFRFERGEAELAKLARLVCPGDARLERRNLRDGQTESVDRLWVRELNLDQQTQRLVCRGPGWLHTAARGRGAFSALQVPGPGSMPDESRFSEHGMQGVGAAQGGRMAQGADAGQDGWAGRQAWAVQPGGSIQPDGPARQGRTPGLSFLGVEFQQALEGNLDQRELAFTGQVRAVYGPVSRWDEALSAEHPEALGETGFTLQCERLSAAEMNQLADGTPAYDLEASGGAIVEGYNFTAHAHRITYSQAKDLLLLEGTGRDDAKLVRRAPNGSQVGETQAGKIYYWRSRNRVRVEDIRGFDVNDLGFQRR